MDVRWNFDMVKFVKIKLFYWLVLITSEPVLGFYGTLLFCRDYWASYTFVRGNYSDGNGDIVSNIETENDENTLPVQVLSKESRIDK